MQGNLLIVSPTHIKKWMYFQCKWHSEEQKDGKGRLDQNWNTVSQIPGRTVLDVITWAPIALGSPLPLDLPTPVHVASFLAYVLLCSCFPFVGSYYMVQAFSDSWGLHCKLDSTFPNTYDGPQESDPITHCPALVSLWNLCASFLDHLPQFLHLLFLQNQYHTEDAAKFCCQH